MNINIAGEDQVTQAIIERLISEYRPDFTINIRWPVRGGQIQNLVPKLNLLDTPTFLLTDLDSYNCPPELLKHWLEGKQKNPNLLFRVAKDEAETWLMADREGFSKWMETDIGLIPMPKIIDNRTGAREIIFPYKPSLYMMRDIAIYSKNRNLKEYLTPIGGAKKGPAYNSAILPFIKNEWNTENAAINSESLTRAIDRLKKF